MCRSRKSCCGGQGQEPFRDARTSDGVSGATDTSLLRRIVAQEGWRGASLRMRAEAATEKHRGQQRSLLESFRAFVEKEGLLMSADTMPDILLEWVAWRAAGSVHVPAPSTCWQWIDTESLSASGSSLSGFFSVFMVCFTKPAYVFVCKPV